MDFSEVHKKIVEARIALAKMIERAKEIDSKSHVYVFVYMDADLSPEYYVVPADIIAQYVRQNKLNAIPKSACLPYKDGWTYFS